MLTATGTGVSAAPAPAPASAPSPSAAPASPPAAPGARTPAGDPITGVSFVNSTTGWSVGSDATGQAEILYTTNQGNTWTRLAIPQSLRGDRFNDVGFSDLSHGWVVGAQPGQGSAPPAGLVLATADGGSTWSVQSLPSGVGPLAAVQFLDNSHGWASGVSSTPGSGVILGTSNGGTTWTMETIPGSITRVTDVSFVGSGYTAAYGWATVAFAGTPETPGILVSSNGGMTWTQQTVPQGIATLNAVNFADQTYGWAAGAGGGGGGVGSAPGAMLVTLDGGATWTLQALPPGVGALNDVAFFGQRDGWAVGSMQGGAPAVMVDTVDGGTTWTIDQLPTDSSNLLSLSVIDPGNVFAGGAGTCLNGSIVWLTNSIWVEQLPQWPAAPAVINGLSAQSASNVLAVGADQCGDGIIDLTTNGGALWSHIALPPVIGPLRGVAFPTSTNAWAVGGSAAGSGVVIEHSSDGGLTWQPQVPPSSLGGLNGVTFLDANNGFAVGSGPGGGEVIHTSNGGGTWAPVTTPSGSLTLTGVTFINNNIGLVVGETTSNQAGVWRSTDGGQTWTLASIGINGQLFGVGFAAQDTDAVWVVGSAPGPSGGGLIFSSRDQGVSFAQQTPPQGVSFLNSVIVTSPTSALAGGGSLVQGGGLIGTIISTTDTGSTWSPGTLPNGVGPIIPLVMVNGGVSSNFFWAGDPGAGGAHILTSTDGSTWTEQVTPSLFGGQLKALAPTRILDTRSGQGACSPSCSRLGSGGSVNVTVTGNGVPADAAGVVLNVTVVPPAGSPGSFLTVYPTGTPGGRPLASSLNYANGKVVANLVEVAVGSGGQVTAYNNAGNADVVFDVAGYFTRTVTGEDGIDHALAPVRILDTRAASGHCLPAGCAPLGPGGVATLQVTGAGGVPATGVSAVVINLTETNATAPGSFLTVYPSDQSRPTVSNLNFVAGQTVPNRVTVKVSPGGQVSIYNLAGNVDVIIDVDGWYTDATGTDNSTGAYIPLSPSRVLDTRAPSQTGTCASACTSVGPHSTLNLSVAGLGGVPAMSSTLPPTAVVLNVTVTNPTSASFLTVFPGPAGATNPVISDLNYAAGSTIPNLVVVKLGPDGTVNLFNNSGSVDVIADVVGFYD